MPPEPVASKYPWLDVTLTDALTRKTFTLASLKGKTVLLHPFAVW
jgi:hypothetical protein